MCNNTQSRQSLTKAKARLLFRCVKESRNREMEFYGIPTTKYAAVSTNLNLLKLVSPKKLLWKTKLKLEVG